MKDTAVIVQDVWTAMKTADCVRLRITAGSHYVQDVWTAIETADGVLMSHISADCDELYPGRVTINVTYQLTEDSQLVLRMSAITSGKATPINPTSHSYFNLAGEVTSTE